MNVTSLQYYSVPAPENSALFQKVQEDEAAFRAHMDRCNAERKAQKQPDQNAIQPKLLRDCEGWTRVPPNLKTAQQWLRAGRRVRKQEQPVARVVYPEIVEGQYSFGPDTVILDETDDFSVVSAKPTPLFDLDQTRPYQATPRMFAYWAFEDIFLKHSRKDCWIRKTDAITGEELEEWLTESEHDFFTKFHKRNLLSSNLIRRHINQRQIIGVKSGTLTRFVVIDLDFHGRNQRVFEAQAQVLLDKFHGVGTWHYQVKRHDVTGLQLIHVFDRPKELAVVQQEVRAILVELDAQHPELAAEARAVGMKTLAELEVYPTQNGNGVRLPLCRDREMLLDKPLPLVTYRKKQVQDVEGYIRWLEDPNRQHLPKEKVLGYLHYHAWERTSLRVRAASKPSTSRAVQFDQRRWRGNMRRWLYEFWIEGNANGRPLNEHIAVLARLAAVQGYSEEEIRDCVNAFVRSLPKRADACSSRLMKGKFHQIENVVRSTAEYAYESNGHQPDPEGSTDIFAAALMRWPGFDALDMSTWTVPVTKTTVIPNWSDEQRRRLCAFFRRPLFVKDDDLIIRFINGIVNLTIAKEKEGHGWGKEYLLKWMISQFPEIKCAKDEKRQRIIKCLESEGIIQVLFRGRSGMYATHWSLGSVAKLALGMTDSDQEQEKASIIQEALLAPSITSIYYGSLFSDEDLLESGCIVATGGNNARVGLLKEEPVQAVKQNNDTS